MLQTGDAAMQCLDKNESSLGAHFRLEMLWNLRGRLIVPRTVDARGGLPVFGSRVGASLAAARGMRSLHAASLPGRSAAAEMPCAPLACSRRGEQAQLHLHRCPYGPLRWPPS